MSTTVLTPLDLAGFDRRHVRDGDCGAGRDRLSPVPGPLTAGGVGADKRVADKDRPFDPHL